MSDLDGTGHELTMPDGGSEGERECKEFVYFIRGGPFVKVGMSWNPHLRHDKMRPNCPYELELIGDITGGRDTESLAHRCLRSFHMRAEWYHWNSVTEGAIRKWLAAGRVSHLGEMPASAPYVEWDVFYGASFVITRVLARSAVEAIERAAENLKLDDGYRLRLKASRAPEPRRKQSRKKAA